jgi:hypothetical protein
MASYNFFKDIWEKFGGKDRRINKRIIKVCFNYVGEFQTSSQPLRNWVILINALCSSPCDDAFDFQQSNSTLIRQTSQYFTFFCSPDCWLEVSMHPQCPATGCSTQLFIVWLVFSHWDGSQVSMCYQCAMVCFSCGCPNLNSSGLKPLLWRQPGCPSKLYTSSLYRNFAFLRWGHCCS